MEQAAVCRKEGRRRVHMSKQQSLHPYTAMSLVMWHVFPAVCLSFCAAGGMLSQAEEGMKLFAQVASAAEYDRAAADKYKARETVAICSNQDASCK